MSWLSEAWDSFTGAKQAREARDTATQIANAAANTQANYTKEGMAQYLDYLTKALASTEKGTEQGIAAQLAGAQASADLAREGAIQKMNWNLPTQAASLSALQALPQLQLLMGLPAYNLPTTIDTSAPSAVNISGLYQNAMQNPIASGAGSISTGGTSTPSNYQLTPYTGKAMDITASPLYKWQSQQMQENVNREMAARGYAGSPAGVSILANEYSKLAANESDKNYNRLLNMVNLGAGMPGATGGTGVGTTMAQATQGVGENLSNIYNQAANARAGLYEGAGTTLAAGYNALGSNAASLGNTKAGLALSSANTPSLLSTLTNLYGLYATRGKSLLPSMNLFGSGGSAKNVPSHNGLYGMPSS